MTHVAGTGIDAPQPRLSWILQSGERQQRQTAYQVLVSDTQAGLEANRGNIWDSGRVQSHQSTHVEYAGQPLRSGRQYWWKVRVWDQDGQASSYSRAASWQMGLLAPSDWQAHWISFDTGPAVEMEMKPSPCLRREFVVDQPIVRATLYATARGLYRLRLNGAPVGDAVLAPDWTDYNRRICYNTYDVTEQIRPGANAIAAVLGDGWYCGYVGWQGGRNHYGAYPELFVQLHLEGADGNTVIVGTDGAWKGASGPIRFSDLLMGEHYDARRELSGWDRAGFEDAGWGAVATDHNQSRLVASQAEPVQVVERIPARSVDQPAPGIYVFDLGQNFAGWVRMKVRGEAGTPVQLRYGELLNADGTVYTGNLRTAKATDTYILKGEGDEEWEPHFTYHGFRYVEVRGFPGMPSPETITGCVVHSHVPQVGQFECSNPMVNQLWRNILWGQRSNFVSIPTDCPQRDERLGWLGDVLVFARTACLNMDSAAFFTRWMTNVEDAQSSEGAFPDVAPRLVTNTDGAPAWGDAGIFLPWTLCQLYGDRRIIERHYAAMTRWMDYIHEANPSLLRLERRNRDYGDWVSYKADTSRDMLATAFWAHDAYLMAEMARVIGRPDDAAGYGQLFQDIRDAFVEAFVSADGRIKGDTQTGYVLALHMDLLPAELRAPAARRLVDDIKQRDWHLSTGFIGTSYLLPVLAEAGYLDVAYRLLLNDTIPSWGYMIARGATTIWERWDSLTADNQVFDPSTPTFLHPTMGPVAGMNSFNHYAFGVVGEWLYRYVAGIDVDPAGPGYQQIRIQPHPGGGLSSARASYESVHGTITSDWRLSGGELQLTVSIPANTTATVYIPGSSPNEITEGGQALESVTGIDSIREDGGRTVLTIGSGTYSFHAKLQGML